MIASVRMACGVIASARMACGLQKRSGETACGLHKSALRKMGNC